MDFEKKDQSKSENLIENGYEFNFSSPFSQAFNTVNKNAGLFIGFTALFFLVSFAGNILESRVLPLNINIISNVLTALWLPGIMLAAHYYITRRAINFNQFFDGHKTAGPLIGLHILRAIIVFLPIIPAFVSLYYNDQIIEQYLEMIRVATEVGGFYMPTISTLSVLLLIGGSLVSLFLGTSYILAVPILLFEKKGIWQAMEVSRQIVAKRFFIFLGMYFLIGIINGLSAMLLLLPAFYFYPVTFATIYFAYRDIFKPEEESDDEWIEHLVEE